jgi:hypothetical protein
MFTEIRNVRKNLEKFFLESALTHLKSICNLRDEFSQEKFGFTLRDDPYHENFAEAWNAANEIYPISILKLSNHEKRLLKLP